MDTFGAVWGQAAGYIINQVFYWIFGPIAFLATVVSAIIIVCQQLRQAKKGKKVKPATVKDILMPWVPLMVTGGVFLIWVLIGFSFLMPFNIYQVEQSLLSKKDAQIADLQRQCDANRPFLSPTKTIETEIKNDDTKKIVIGTITFHLTNSGKSTAYNIRTRVCGAPDGNPQSISAMRDTINTNPLQPGDEQPYPITITQSSIIQNGTHIVPGETWFIYYLVTYGNSKGNEIPYTDEYWFAFSFQHQTVASLAIDEQDKFKPFVQAYYEKSNSH